jgi:hypothetical protein
MKIHVALQNDSVKTQVAHSGAILSRGATQTRKESPCEGAWCVKTAYMTGNMHPTKKHRQHAVAPFVPGTLDG